MIRLSRISIIALITLLAFPTRGSGQSHESLFARALEHKRQFEFRASLDLLNRLLRTDSTRTDWLSEASYAYAKLGYGLQDKKQQDRYYGNAHRLARKALSRDSLSVPAHYAYVVALGRLTENATNRQKLDNARLIRKECDWILRHAPDHAGTWHVLGRWHREFAGISTFEKFLVKNLLGGWPEGGTWFDAIVCFTRAKQLESGIIFHYYELALTYHMRYQDYRDRYAARMLLQEALKLKIDPDDPDQVSYRVKCVEMLGQLK